ncbi:hypothetical protein [uncultured Chryseobacterium sp.]|uniref:hypothetical protein n=1 Tax=uncultured Chryseobacterium sp. TaxID=259322 RepID=UPI0025F722D1|nr:hypothetical protein [uncultured Chryseobacterium sp.]
MIFLSINAFQLLTAAVLVAAMYIYAFAVLYKNRAGLLPYLVLILFPLAGALGIIFGNLLGRSK